MRGDTEIDNFNDQFVRIDMIHCIDQEVLWLHISMDDFALMTVRNGRQQLSHDVCGLIFGESLFLQDCFKELPTRAKLLNNVEVIIVFEEFI